MVKLLNTSSPEVGEGLLSYIIRLAELNYYDSPSRITSLAGLPNIRTTSARITAIAENMGLLAKLSGVPVSELQCRTYPAVQQHRMPFRVVSFFGHAISHSHIGYEAPKICPPCLQESGYCRAVWDLLPVTTCPVHCCRLLRHCPGCGQRISWKRRKLCICDCGSDCRNIVVSLIDQSETKLTQLVHNFLQLELSTKPGATLASDNPLRSLDLLHLFTAVLFVGGQHEGFTDIAGTTWESQREKIDPHPAILKAISIFDGWPYSFWALLDSLRYEDEASSKPGIKGAFGEFYRSLFLRLKSAQFEFMRAAFREYLEENPIFRSDERRSTIGRTGKKYLTKMEAQRRLGGPRIVNRLIQEGKLRTITGRTDKNRKIVLVETKGVHIIQRQFKASLNTKQTADKLGISEQSVTDLIEQKCLEPLRGPTIDRYPAWRFKLAAITELKRKIKKRIVDHDSELDSLTFHHALKIVQRVGYDVGKFVRSLLDGEISAVGSIDDGKVLADLRFPNSQISELADRIVENLNGDCVYVKEAATILKLNTGAVISLCKSGVIDAKPARGYARKGLLISRRALQDFSSNHVRATDLANDLNTNSATIIQILANKGIEPIIATRRDNQRQYIFRKNHLQGVDWVEVRNDVNARGFQSMPAKTFDVTETATLIGCSQETIKVIVENGLLKTTSQRTKQQRETTDHIFTARAIKNYLRQFGRRTDVVSGKVAARILNESSVTFHNSWVKSGRLRRFETNARCGRSCYFLYEDVQEIARLKTTSLTTVETTQLLSVSQQQLSKLAHRGILEPVSGPKIDGCGRNRYLRSAVEDVMIGKRNRDLRQIGRKVFD